MGVITILYEDSSKGKPKNFGPHMLVKQCICDLLNREPWELKLDDKLVSWPMPSLVPEVVWEAAVAQKQLLERDRIFNVAALPEPTSRRARDQLVEHLPSFKRLVTHIARRL